MEEITRKLIIAEIIRVLFVCVVLFGTKIPLFYKIILIMVSDSFDSRVPKWIFDEWVDSNGSLYQISDKITDTISYGILLYHVISTRYLEEYQNQILSFLYFLRLIGITLFLFYKMEILLFYFPNFFLEFLLVFVLVKYFELCRECTPYLICLAVIWKISQEYYLHVYKKDHPNSLLR